MKVTTVLTTPLEEATISNFTIVSRMRIDLQDASCEETSVGSCDAETLEDSWGVVVDGVDTSQGQ